MVKICVSGAINWDINLFVDRFPEIGEEIPVNKITRVPGGKAANVAVASARILGPGEVALIGCLGRDDIARQQIEILRGEGVEVSGIKIDDESESGQAYIVIDRNGRNIINTFFGANLKLTPNDLYTPHISSLIHDSSIFVLIDPPLETIKCISKMAKSFRKTVMWDAGVRSTMGLERLKEVLSNVNYLVVNEVEVKNLTGEHNPEKAWEKLSEINGDLHLIVKLGSRGCMLIDQRRIIMVPGVNLKEMGLNVVNTVGCGDAFLGVFAAYKVLGLSDLEALEMANLAGALKATKAETRGSPSRENLEKYIAYRKTGILIRGE
jgi:ribokinase